MCDIGWLLFSSCRVQRVSRYVLSGGQNVHACHTRRAMKSQSRLVWRERVVTITRARSLRAIVTPEHVLSDGHNVHVCRTIGQINEPKVPPNTTITCSLSLTCNRHICLVCYQNIVRFDRFVYDYFLCLRKNIIYMYWYLLFHIFTHSI